MCFLPGAVVAREYGLPCVVNVPGATHAFKSGTSHITAHRLQFTILSLNITPEPLHHISAVVKY